MSNSPNATDRHKTGSWPKANEASSFNKACEWLISEIKRDRLFNVCPVAGLATFNESKKETTK